MSHQEIVVKEMTKEELNKLDKTANKALLVVFVVFVLVLGGLFLKYRRDYAKGDGSSAQNQPAPPRKDPASAPAHHAAHVNMGQGMDQRELDIMLDQGKFEEAKQKIQKFLKADSSNFLANVQMGVIFYRMGEIDKALEYLKKAQNINEGDLFCLQILGKIYTLTDPQKAVEFYEKNLTYEIDRKDLSLGAIRAYHTAIAQGKLDDYEKKRLLDASTNLLNDCNKSTDSYIPRSLLDLLNGENAYFRGKYNVAMSFYRKVPLTQTNIGDVNEKVNAATALGIISLKASDNKYSAYQYFEKALKIITQDKTVRLDSTIPRKEELSLVIHTLFNKPHLFFRLQRLKTGEKNSVLSKIKPVGKSNELKKLIYTMAENEHNKKPGKAIKNAKEILEIANKNEGFYYDVAMLTPIFKASLLIYTGDRFLELKNTKEALSYYNQAKNSYPILDEIVNERIKKAR